MKPRKGPKDREERPGQPLATRSDDEIPEQLVHAMTPVDRANLQTIRSIQTDADFGRHFQVVERFMERLLPLKDSCTLFARALILRIRNSLIHTDGLGYDSSSLVAALAAADLPAALNFGSGMFRTVTANPHTIALDRMLERFPVALRVRGGEINSLQAGRAHLGQDVAAEQVEIGQCTAGAFTCPILYEDDPDPVILVAVPRRPLLVGLTKEVTQRLIDCPLTAMIHSKFLQRFITYIDHPISLTAMREAAGCRRPIVVSPLTRRPILGGLTLGSHQSHVNATNWTLMQLMAGGKRLGNPDFWFAVLWLLLEDGRIPFLKEMLPFVREHMLFRLRASMAHASLTGLPGFVNYSVPLGVACWVSLCSPAFPGIIQRFDTLRLHMQHTRPLFELLKLAKFPIPESIAVYNKRLRVLFTLREMATKKFVEMKAAVRALTQKCYRVRAVPESIRVREKATFSLLVPVDGPADEEQVRLALSMLPKYCREISLEEVVGIADLITKPNISLEQIELGVDWVPPRLPPPVVDWAHYQGVELPPVRVCLATMRPFYFVATRGRQQSWKQAFRQVIPSGRIFSVHNFWGLFVNKYRIYPTADALIAFIWARYATNGYASALPADVKALVDECLRAFAPAATFLPREVSRRFLASRPVHVRENMEMRDPQNPARA